MEKKAIKVINVLRNGKRDGSILCYLLLKDGSKDHLGLLYASVFIDVASNYQIMIGQEAWMITSPLQVMLFILVQVSFLSAVKKNLP